MASATSLPGGDQGAPNQGQDPDNNSNPKGGSRSALDPITLLVQVSPEDMHA